MEANEQSGISESCGSGCADDCAYQANGIAGGNLSGESDRICRLVEELRLLLNVSKTLQQSPGFDEIVRPVLRRMAESFGP